jgi:DHA1 family inner membrane transport protein
MTDYRATERECPADHDVLVEAALASRPLSPLGLLCLLSAAACLTPLSWLMLGPLLVVLAQAFQTSVAMTGQLVAVTAIPWGITAPLAGPISDTYGRRPMLLLGMLLMAVGMLGAGLAWTYGALLAFRLLTGVGGALILPNATAIVADVFPPAARGKPMGWLVSASGVGAAVGVPGVACLLAVGGWRLPFGVLGLAMLVVWGLFWVWLPPGPRQPGHALAFGSHYREVGTQAPFWYVLAANALQQMVFMGMFSYLAAHLMQTYHLQAGDTALPLALAGGGVIAGGFLGGRVADHPRRVAWFALTCLGGGLLAALVFVARVSPWAVVALACGAAGLLRISTAVTPVLVMEWAGRSRTTATGVFAMSNQIGGFGGPALGGFGLALGGFPLVGLLWLGVGIIGAVVIRLKVQDSAAFLTQRALRQGPRAPKQVDDNHTV